MKTIKILLGLTTVGTLGAAVALSGAGCSSSSSSPGDAGTDTGTLDSTTDTNHPPTDSGTGDTSHPPTDSGGGDTGMMACNPTAQDAGTGQIDRMGRAAVNTALNLGDDAAKDMYNQDTTFKDWSGATPYDTNFNNNLQFIDSLDGKVDWAPMMGVHPLTKILQQDALFVFSPNQCNAANNFCEGSYLSVEVFLLTGNAPTDCGGRTPNDSATDKTLSVLVAGPGGLAGCSPMTQDTACAVNDGVKQATTPATHTFPYLAAPN